MSSTVWNRIARAWCRLLCSLGAHTRPEKRRMGPPPRAHSWSDPRDVEIGDSVRCVRCGVGHSWEGATHPCGYSGPTVYRIYCGECGAHIASSSEQHFFPLGPLQ